MSSINTVFFDLDGTLLDTAPDLVSSLNSVLQQYNKPEVSVDEMRPLVSQGGVAMLMHAFNIEKDDPYIPEYRQQFLQIYSSRIAEESKLFDGMSDVLVYLESRNIPWGVVTNKHERFAIPLLAKLNLLDKTCVVVGGDTTDHLKPHPAPLLHACEKSMRDVSQAIYIGDAHKDIVAGKAAGLQTIAASYGYVDSDPADWGADYVIHNCKELLQLLQDILD